MRVSFHYFAFHFYFIFILCLIFVNGTVENGLADDYFEPSYRIEPTPVYVQEKSSSYYKIGWPKNSDISWYEGSGREKRDYNLEDFLVWMPSGDGSEEQWNQNPTNTEWVRPYTKTVYVTMTKYETVVLPTNVNAYSTVKNIFPTKSTTNNFGKDIYGNFGRGFETGCKIPSFFGSRTYPFGSTFSMQNDQSYTEKPYDFSNVSVPEPKVSRPSTKSMYPDIRDFLHPSLGYEGPFSTFTHPQTTSYATPTLPTRVKEIDRSGTATIVSIFSTNDFTMHSTHLELPTKFIPKTTTLSSQFTVSTNLYSSTTDISKTSKIYYSISSRDNQTQESTTPALDIIFTGKNGFTPDLFINVTPTPTDGTEFAVPVSTVLNATDLLLLNYTTPVTESVEHPPIPHTDIIFETTTLVAPVSDDIDIESSIVGNKTSCNCSTPINTSTSANKITANGMSEKIDSITLPSLPDDTSYIPSVFPSPSNNATTPINKSLWVLTTLKGPPSNNNSLKFKNDITIRLAKAYKYAYSATLVKNSSVYSSAASLRQNRKVESLIVLTTDGSVSRSRYRRAVSPISTKFLFTKAKHFANEKAKKNIGRIRRQTAEEISVRIQSINYMVEPNTTEVVYSVFKGGQPVEAMDAVAKMNAVNETVVEKILGYSLAVIAEEYLPTERIQDSKKNDMIIFGSIIAGVSLAVIIVIIVASLLFKNYKRKHHMQSTDNFGTGSEGYSHRSHTDTEVGRENLGFADMHDEESTPEDGGSRRSSQSAMDSHMSRPSFAQEPVPYPRTKSAEELGYAVVDRRVQPSDEFSTSPEHEYSTPKPISQIHANIQVGLDNAQDKKSSEFIPGTSLPRFLPPPRQVLVPSPYLDNRPQVKPRTHLIDESYLPKPGTSQDQPIITEVQEQPSLERSMSGMSKGSSELEISPDSPSIGSGVGIRRLRRRFHDLLDDAFSLMNGQKPGDKVTPLATPHHTRNSRAKSAMPLRRPRLLDDFGEGTSRTLTPERPHISLRPWSAAAVIHSPRDMISILPSGDSTEGSPRSAWGDHGRSITPVNLPHQRSYDRPDSAPTYRMSNEGLRTPTPIDPETGLRMYDPAVPLIRAIKEELNRFKASVNTDSSNA